MHHVLTETALASFLSLFVGLLYEWSPLRPHRRQTTGFKRGGREANEWMQFDNRWIVTCELLVPCISCACYVHMVTIGGTKIPFIFLELLPVLLLLQLLLLLLLQLLLLLMPPL